jgi:rubrerythrin
MQKSSQPAGNRTGISLSPELSKVMISGAEELTRPGKGNGRSMAAIDKLYILESDSIGSMPAPLPGAKSRAGTRTKAGGKAKAASSRAAAKKKQSPDVFLNKLGERLAFERSGIRMYESVITKCEAADDAHPVGPVTVKELKHIRDEEAEHFQLLSETIQMLGADPTVQTPDADVAGVAGMGIQHVLSDPRTSMAQCLEMLLTLELTDNAAWEMLIMLAEKLGLDEATEKFKVALQQEEEHLERVRSWVEEMTMAQASRK